MKATPLKKLLILSTTCIGLVVSATAFSAIAVVVHPSNSNALSETDISRIFLGKKKSFPDGANALPIDQQEGSAARSSFVGDVLKKNDQQLKAYWAQLLFTGKGTPPTDVKSAADVKRMVAKNPSFIGYIDASDIDDSIKVVYQF